MAAAPAKALGRLPLFRRHGFLPLSRQPAAELGRTTGRYLYEKGILPRPDVKGSRLDRAMQHSRYPFVVFNLFVFWYFLPRHGYAEYEKRTAALFREKIAAAKAWLEEYRDAGKKSRLHAWLRERG